MSAGERTAALAPPAYGIDLVDHGTRARPDQVLQRAEKMDTGPAGWGPGRRQDVPTANRFVIGFDRSDTAVQHVAKVNWHTTPPKDPPGMKKEWKPHLADPSKGGSQILTRMHAIRGKFGGPSSEHNMFFGTALSNNFHADSHYRLVEKPLEDFLDDAPNGEKRSFVYRVKPNFRHIPPYMLKRIERIKIKDAKRLDARSTHPFETFASRAVPHAFKCEAVLFKDDKRSVRTKTVERDVATDIGAPEGGDASPLAKAEEARYVRNRMLKWAGVGAVGGLIAGLKTGGLAWLALPLLAAGGALAAYATSEWD